MAFDLKHTVKSQVLTHVYNMEINLLLLTSWWRFIDFVGQGLLLHFVAFFYVASLFSTGVDNEKVGVDNGKALELTNSTVFHRGRQ